MNRRYFEWDYTQGQVIQYERAGECNGCGACCLARVSYNITLQPIGGEVAAGRNGCETTNEQGRWFEVEVDGLRAFYGEPRIDFSTGFRCPALSLELRCTEHARKQGVCETWPINPAQVQPFEECSYTFKEVGRWPLRSDDDGKV